jgi:hypothetical protein
VVRYRLFGFPTSETFAAEERPGVCFSLTAAVLLDEAGFFEWAPLHVRRPADRRGHTALGVAAVFILFNSIASLLSNFAIVKALPADLPIYAAAVMLGAVIGTSSE